MYQFLIYRSTKEFNSETNAFCVIALSVFSNLTKPIERWHIGDTKVKFQKMNISDLVDFKPNSIDCDLEDGLLKEIRLISDERLVKIRCDYAQLIVLEKSPPQYKEIYKLTALDQYGSSVFREFSSKQEADEFCSETDYINIKIETIMEKVNE